MRRRAAAAALAGLLAWPALAGAGLTGNSITVEAGGKNRFKPDKLTASANQGSFTWLWGSTGTEREHNVRQDRTLFDSGEPTSTNPTPVGFNVNLPAGEFHYYCEVHGSKRGGMDGVVAVRPERTATTPDGFEVTWSTGAAAIGHQFDVRYRVDGGDWRPWFRNTSLGGQAFGTENEPVNVRPGRTYRIQARTEDDANPTRASDWSPSLTVKT